MTTSSDPTSATEPAPTAFAVTQQRSGFRRWAPVGLLAALVCASAAQFALPLMQNDSTPAPVPSATASVTATPEPAEVIFESARGTTDRTEEFASSARGAVWDDLVISTRQEGSAGTLHVTTKLADVLQEDPRIAPSVEDRAAMGAAVGICEAAVAVFDTDGEEVLPVGVYDRDRNLLVSLQSEDGEPGECTVETVEEAGIGDDFEDLDDGGSANTTEVEMGSPE